MNDRSSVLPNDGHSAGSSSKLAAEERRDHRLKPNMIVPPVTEPSRPQSQMFESREAAKFDTSIQEFAKKLREAREPVSQLKETAAGLEAWLQVHVRDPDTKDSLQSVRKQLEDYLQRQRIVQLEFIAAQHDIELQLKAAQLELKSAGKPKLIRRIPPRVEKEGHDEKPLKRN